MSKINVKFQSYVRHCFATSVPRKSMSIHSFWIIASSILIVFVIMLENDDFFKLSIYLNIYIFFLCRHFARPKCWGISVKDSKFTEVFIQRNLLITCPKKTSKVLTLKLTADLIQSSQHWHYRKCLIVSLRLFVTC